MTRVDASPLLGDSQVVAVRLGGPRLMEVVRSAVGARKAKQ